MSITDVLLDSSEFDASVQDINIGQHWTAVAVETAVGTRGGIASASGALEGHCAGGPSVRDAGRLLEHSAQE